MIHLLKASSIAVVTIAILSFGLCGSSMAQNTDMGTSSSATNAESSQVSIDDATLQRTAKAFVKVTRIVDDQKRTMANQTDQQAMQQSAAQAESQKLAAVKSEGLEPQQYNHVLQVVQNDSNLQQKFLSYVKDNRSNSPDSSL